MHAEERDRRIAGDAIADVRKEAAVAETAGDVVSQTADVRAAISANPFPARAAGAAHSKTIIVTRIVTLIGARRRRLYLERRNVDGRNRDFVDLRARERQSVQILRALDVR